MTASQGRSSESLVLSTVTALSSGDEFPILARERGSLVVSDILVLVPMRSSCEERASNSSLYVAISSLDVNLFVYTAVSIENLVAVRFEANLLSNSSNIFYGSPIWDLYTYRAVSVSAAPFLSEKLSLISWSPSLQRSLLQTPFPFNAISHRRRQRLQMKQCRPLKF